MEEAKARDIAASAGEALYVALRSGRKEVQGIQWRADPVEPGEGLVRIEVDEVPEVAVALNEALAEHLSSDEKEEVYGNGQTAMFIGTKREETKEEGERWLFPDPEGKDWHAGLQRTIVGVRRNRDIRANEWCILRQIQAHYPLQFRWEEAEDPFGTEDPPNSILTAAFCRMDAEEAGSEGGLERREGGPEVRACSRIEAVLTCNRKGGGSRNTQWGVALALEGSNAVRGKARLSALRLAVAKRSAAIEWGSRLLGEALGACVQPEDRAQAEVLMKEICKRTEV